MFQGSKGGGSTFKQNPDNLRSNDTFEGVLGLCIGPIKGPVRGLKSVRLDDTAIENETGELNFPEFAAVLGDGDPAKFPQTIQLKLGAGAAPIQVGLSLVNPTGSNPNWATKTVPNTNAAFLDLRFVAQQLFRQDKKGIYDTTATLEVQLKPVGSSTWINPTIGTASGQYNEQGGGQGDMYRYYVPESYYQPDGSPAAGQSNFRITGKTQSAVVYELRLGVPNTGAYADTAWDVRVRLLERDTYQGGPNGENQEKRTISWESVAAVYPNNLGEHEDWRGVAWLQLYGKASDQLTGVPEVEGDYYTKIVSVPPSTIFNPETRTYSPGVWDGSWAKAYTNDPAWVISDAISDALSGLSLIASGSYLNKWDALEASKWFSQLVPDGDGGFHPRYSMNIAISEPQKAEEFIQYLAGAVGALAWDQGDGEWRIKCDKPEAAVDIFTLDNIENDFVYSHTDVDTQYNDITGQFKNASMGFRPDAVRLFDNPSIAAIGRKPLKVALVGCTNRQEAMRRIKLRLRASVNENRIVTFTTNRRGRNVQPLDTILIADGDLGDRDQRTTGRAISIAPDRLSFQVRDPLRLEVGVAYSVKFTVPNPAYNPSTASQPTGEWNKPTLVVERAVANSSTQRGNVTTIYLSEALPEHVDPNVSVALSAPGLPTLPVAYRVTSVAVQDDNERITISALIIDTGKWDAADNVSKEDAVFQDLRGVVPPPQLLPGESLLNLVRVPIEQGSQVNLSASWVRPAGSFVSGFRIQYSVNGGALQTAVERQQLTEWELPNAGPGIYRVEVCTMDRRGGYSLPLVEELEVTQALIDATQIFYVNPGTGLPLVPIQDLMPREPGATYGAPVGAPVGGMEAGALVQKVVQVDTDLEDAKTQIDDLFTTYGSTSSAAASAQQALAAAQASEAFKIATESARDVTIDARNTATSASSNALTARNQAQAARDAAQAEAGKAFLDAQAAAGSAGTAAGYAQTASSKADEASGFASAANGSAVIANSKAGEAQGFASAAATSASGAATSASDAGNFASSANSSAVTAQAAATLLAPSTFKDGGTYFSHIIGDEDTASRPEQAFSNISYPMTPDYGRVLRTADVLMGYTHISFRRRIRPTERSRRFRVTVRARMLTNPAQGNALLIAAVYGLADNWQTLCYGGWDDYYDTSQALARPTVASGIFTVSTEFSLRQNPGPDVNGNIPVNGVTAGCYFVNEANPLGWSAGSCEILSMELTDVTEQRSAEQAAAASATSASNAAASETVAGQQASAAQGFATNASTFAGQAATSASNAATSESNAAGSANTATTQAGLAAQARNQAADSASAANTSAGLASASQSAAGSSATAAQSAQLSAEAARNSTRDIFQSQWPSSFSPEGRRAYGGLDTGHGAVEAAPAAAGAWPDGYAWHNYTSDPANSRYVWLMKSRPTVTARRLRASCWVWHDMDPATDIRFQLYAQSGPSPENAGAVYNGAGGSITNQVPRFVWTKIIGEYLTDSAWQAHYTFSLEVVRLTPAPFGCNWYTTGFTIEDITSEHLSAQSAAASLSSAQSASASQGLAGASAQASEASRVAAEAANGSAQGAASVANSRAVAADASATSAASSATLSAQYRDQAQGSASAAATSATLADGHRSAAATSASLASTFQTGSAVAASASFPSTFENDGEFFSYLSGNEYTGIRPEAAYPASISYPVRGDVGKVMRISYSAGYTHVATRKRLSRATTRRYRITVRGQVIVNGPLGLNYIVATCYGLTQDYNTITYDGVSYAAIPGVAQGINANTGSGIFEIGIDFWSGPTSSSTVWIVPSFYVVGTNGSGTFGETGIVDIFSLKVDDVTSEVEAQTYANAASTSATQADGHRSSAATSASLSAGYRDEAFGHRNSAQSFASQASGSAAAASASESTTLGYVTQASSFGVQSLMKNSFFATPGWTAWVPPSWLLWSNENTPFIGPYLQNTSRPNPYGPNALQIDRNSGAAGIRQGTGPLGAGWYVAEAEAWVEDGTWAGVGMHFSFNNGYSGNLDFGIDPDTNEQVFAGTSFRNRKFSKLFWNGADSNGLDLYVMAGWGGFSSWGSASGFARTIWHKALMRPATQQEIQARRAFENAAANTAQISSVNSTLTTAISALAARTTTVEARYDGLPGYNRLPSSEIINLRTTGWQAAASHSGYTLGVNGAGEYWKPRGENVLSIFQLGRVGSESYGFWVSDHFSVTPGEWLQHYVFFASHRASCEIYVDFWDENGNFSGQYGGFTGRVYNGDNGGPDPSGYARLGVKSYQVPTGAVTGRLVMRKYDTIEGHGDSWAWFWRPYVGAARQGQNDWNPYQASSGRALTGAVEARTTVTEGAIADINGAAAFYEVVTAASGSNPAVVSLKAGKNGSTVNLSGDRVIIRNPVNGQQVEVARFENGIAQLNNAMIRRLRVAPRSNSQIFLPVMLRPIIRLGTDGQAVQYQNGASFGAPPERITPDLNGLPALAAGESYDIRAINITDIGFTAYAKKITASDPVGQYTGAGVNVGGTPQWRADKPTAADAYNGNYQFTFLVSGQLLSSEPLPGGGTFNEWRASGAIYATDTGGNWQVIGNYNHFWSGANAGGSTAVTVTVTSSMAIGQNGGYEFGVHPQIGGVASFSGVSYATQVQSNVAPISAPISWVISPPLPDD